MLFQGPELAKQGSTITHICSLQPAFIGAHWSVLPRANLLHTLAPGSVQGNCMGTSDT